MLGVNPITLRRWDKSGYLKAIKIGARNDRRYKINEVEKIIYKGRLVSFAYNPYYGQVINNYSLAVVHWLCSGDNF